MSRVARSKLDRFEWEAVAGRNVIVVAIITSILIWLMHSTVCPEKTLGLISIFLCSFPFPFFDVLVQTDQDNSTFEP